MNEFSQNEIKKEIIENGIIIPPWNKYPKIKRYSIGWRMGYGEGYLHIWHEWFKSFNEKLKLEYFEKYKPIPIEWIDFVANSFMNPNNDEDNKIKMLDRVKWLEELGFVDFKIFYEWYQSVWGNPK